MIEVRVSDVRLGEGRAVALRDTLSVVDLGIDFTQPPEDIVAGLAALIRESIQTGRWTRNRPPYGGNGEGSPGPN
ncbi:hypothetical protein ACWERV_17300 [Streptomyces sp. NPDC004031]